MLTIPAVFVAGILAFLSPCFLPVVPVFVSQMTGVRRPTKFVGQDVGAVQLIGAGTLVSANSMTSGTLTMTASSPSAMSSIDPTSADSAAGQVAVSQRTQFPTGVVESTPTKRMGAALQATAFVAAFSLVFALLWVAVGLVGWVVGDIRQYLVIAAGAVLILLGLHVARLIRIPFIDRTVSYGVRADGGPSYRKSVLLGLSFGAGWSPCVGPILGGVLALAMTQETVLSGFGLLLVFCAGLGLPFIACAVLADRVISFGWVTRHYKAIELFLGLSLIVVGFLMVSGLLERLSASIPAIL